MVRNIVGTSFEIASYVPVMNQYYLNVRNAIVPIGGYCLSVCAKLPFYGEVKEPPLLNFSI